MINPGEMINCPCLGPDASLSLHMQNLESWENRDLEELQASKSAKTSQGSAL